MDFDFFLDMDNVVFPDPRKANAEDSNDDGLLAMGGRLTPEWLTAAYSQGIFPWYPYRTRIIQWFCPQRRFVIFPNEIHVSHSMRQLIKQGKYHITYNTAFDMVIEGCMTAQLRDKHHAAWLGGEMVPAYKAMHQLGRAASVEVWDHDGKLAGGLYGVTLGKNFFGESMFSLVPNASKLALIFLARDFMNPDGIIDCQFETPHLKSMGGRYITYDEYMKYLQ